jgi:hypothetical protein
MNRAKLILGLVVLMMAMMVAFAAQAMAQDLDFDRFDDNGFIFVSDDDDFDGEDCFFDDGNDFFDEDCFFFDDDDDFFDNDGFLDDGFNSFDQEADSGDIDQSFDVSGGGGDNANQCVNVSGSSNTGNLQGSSGFFQFDSDIDDFDQDNVGNDLTVEGDSTVTCDQQVNQAAAAG